MKINIELDITPEEAKELLAPSEKQVELFTKLNTEYTLALYSALSKGAREQAEDLNIFDPFNLMSKVKQ